MWDSESFNTESFSPVSWDFGSVTTPTEEIPPVVPPSTPAGGIVKYVQHADQDNRTALMQYQRKRLEQQIEDEEILAIIIAISQRTLH
ncbi:MAG: hypothetical protein WAW75_00135 [Gallionella sp.]